MQTCAQISFASEIFLLRKRVWNLTLEFDKRCQHLVKLRLVKSAIIEDDYWSKFTQIQIHFFTHAYSSWIWTIVWDYIDLKTENKTQELISFLSPAERRNPGCVPSVWSPGFPWRSDSRCTCPSWVCTEPLHSPSRSASSECLCTSSLQRQDIQKDNLLTQTHWFSIHF